MKASTPTAHGVVLIESLTQWNGTEEHIPPARQVATDCAMSDVLRDLKANASDV